MARLAISETSESRWKWKAMIGRVAIEAARVKSRYCVTGLVSCSTLGAGKRRAAKATKAWENGAAYRIKPSGVKNGKSVRTGVLLEVSFSIEVK